MNSSKPIKFNGTAGGYFVAVLVEVLTMYIIIVGWPIGFNYVAGWVIDNMEVDGKRVKYSAGYMETLGFLLINILLIIVTLGIYAFWFVPKSYRYVFDHTEFVAAAPAPVEQVAEEVAPTAPQEPKAPTMVQ